VFYIDVVKVDRDVAKVARDVVHVAMAIHVCFKCFICFIRMFQSVSFGCCIYMQVFHTYVVSVSSRCYIYFAMTTHVFSSIF
jgi:hypothetical protein